MGILPRSTALLQMMVTLFTSCNKSGCCKLHEYWLLIGWNKAGVTPYTGVAKQVCHGPFKCASCTNFGAKSRATLLAATTFQNLQSWVVKRSTSLLNSFSSSYRTFSYNWPGRRAKRNCDVRPRVGSSFGGFCKFSGGSLHIRLVVNSLLSGSFVGRWVTEDRENAWGTSGKGARNDGGSFFLSPPQSLLIFTTNLHNFTFTLAARGTEEKRTTACGL